MLSIKGVVANYALMLLGAWLIILTFAYEDKEPTQIKNALVEGEWQEEEEGAQQDPFADLWSPDRFSQPREIEPGCWTRSNYGLVRIEGLLLELSPVGDRYVWENFGELTANTRQAVVIKGFPWIQAFLSEGQAAWGTLTVHLSGKDPDNAEATEVSFIPVGTAFAYDATSYE